MRRLPFQLPFVLLLILSACGLARCSPKPIGQDEVQGRFATPLPPVEKPLAVYFIGHSLVGRDMPAFLAQMAGEEHRYESQLGWGAELQAHWELDVPLKGGEAENNHPRFREAHDAIESGAYDAIVLTEKVEIRDSIRYHDSWHYLAAWAKKTWAANPDARVYFFETWHNLDDEEGWLIRLDRDLPRYWESEIADRAMSVDGVERPIYMIPGGQVMAAFARELELRGGLGDVRTIADLFSDTIHFNELGAYLIALTHYAVLYGRSPVGLPRELRLADGRPADAPSEELALLMQRVVWDVVTDYPRTGVAR